MDNETFNKAVLEYEDFPEIWARTGLYEVDPKSSAYDIRTIPRRFTWSFAIVYGVFLILTGYWGLVVSLNLFSFSYFVYRLILFLVALPEAPSEVYLTDKDDLPTFCILLPVRNEQPEIIELLIKSMMQLNYDFTKLDVILLIDKDDKYLEEVKKLTFPNFVRIVSAEAEEPFTKPKVCNIGLAITDAEFITIYDVEDSPEPDQLLRVVQEFQRSGKIQCVQSELRFNTPKETLLAALFSLEYLIWFRMMIKGLNRVQFNDGFIPLGGTSQHFKTKYLREIGGWDAFNVTEDCELGIRLIRNGGSISMISSYTDEVAVRKLDPWIKQRTRWNLGYMITFLVHTQDVKKLVKDIGFYRFVHFFINVGLSIFHSLITPILLIIFVISFFYHQDTFIKELPKITLIGNYVLVVLCAVFTAMRAGEYHRIGLSFIFPFYYLLQPIAAWRALYKLFTKPHTWEKTKKEIPQLPWWDERHRS